MIERIRILFTVITAATAIGLASTAQAQEFLKDKTLTFIGGYSPGGTYDQYTRLIARHINNMSRGIRPGWWKTCPAPAASSPQITSIIALNRMGLPSPPGLRR